MTTTTFRVAAIAIALVATACGGNDDASIAGGDTTTTSDSPTTSTATSAATGDEAAIRAAVVEGAAWGDNVTITIDGDTFTFSSNGLPSHEVLDQYLGDGPDGKFLASGALETPTTVSIPLVPTIAASPITTGGGAIGVAVSGAVFFNPYEGDGSNTVANDDNETIDGVPFIDACGGHPVPNGTTYHYHGIPFCITDALDAAGEHSAIIGYLFDGHAIYGPQDVGGDEPTDLDECMGHTGPTPEFETDTYHYHVSSTANYISECLVGEYAAARGR